MDPVIAIITLKTTFINSNITLWGINQSSWLNVYEGKSQKGMGIENRFQRLPPAHGVTAQRKIFNLAK